jgi:MFS family permease
LLPSHAQYRPMLAILLTAQAMATMDTSITNVAAPAIRADLGTSGGSLQLVIAGYVLAYAVLLITAARLGNDYGYRRLFRMGIAVFTLASLGCGLAPNTALLIVSRIAQGIGAALFVPQVLSLIQHTFEGQERARVVGYYSMIMAVGVTLGQLLGGLVVTIDILGFSWRPAFLINVPIGLVLFHNASIFLPEVRSSSRRKIDATGIFALTASMFLLLLPMTIGREFGWPIWAFASFGFGSVGLFGFLMLEMLVARRGGQPLLDLKSVTAAGVRPGVLIVFIGFATYGGLLFTTALHLQSALGFSPIESGLAFSCYSVGFGTANLLWARLPATVLRWTPTVALLGVFAGYGFLGTALLVWQWWPPIVLPLLLICGAGHGFSFGTVVNQMTRKISPSLAPNLSGIVTTTVQIAIVFGLASFGSIYLANVNGRTSIAGLPLVTFLAATMTLTAIACAVRLSVVSSHK